MLTVLGSHLLDQTLQLFGLPESIALDLALQRDNVQSDDFFHAILHYGQSRVILHASALVPVPAARFTVHGSLGSFIKYGLDQVLKRWQRARARVGDPI